MTARDVVREAMRHINDVGFFYGPDDAPWADGDPMNDADELEAATDFILSALGEAGYTAAKLEHVAWHDDTVHRDKGRTTYATIGCLRFVEESVPENASPLFRIVQVDDQEAKP